MNPELIKYYNESPEVEEWLNAPGGKPLPPARGSASDMRRWRCRRTNALRRIREDFPKRHTALDKQNWRDSIRWQIETVRRCNERLNDQAEL